MAEEKSNKEDTTAKEEKSKKEKKTKNLGKWFREMRSELKKIVWPTPKKTAADTRTVLLFSLCVGACIWLFDAVAALAFKMLLDALGA